MSARGARWLVATAMVAAGLTAAPADARERAVRRFDLVSHGIDGAVAIALDGDHRLWAGDPQGLLLFDGVRFRRVHVGVVARHVLALVTVGGEVAALDRAGQLYLVTAARAEPIAGPTASATRWIGRDHAGRLIAIAERQLWRRAGDVWTAIDRAGAPAPTLAAFAPDGTLWLAADRELWRVDGDGARRVWTSPVETLVALLPRANGELWISDFLATHVWAGDALRTVVPADHPRGRRIDLVERGRSVWVSYDGGLVVVPDGGAPELVGARERLDAGGALLVDHEGSLWTTGFRALYQLPEPDTVAWTTDDGAPAGVRRVLATADSIWMGSWNGVGRLVRGAGIDRSAAVATYDAVCVDGAGYPWATAAIGPARFERGRWVSHGEPSSGSGDCARGAGGRLWLTEPRGVSAIEPGGLPRRVPSPALDDGWFDEVIEDRQGRVWLASARRICQAAAAALAAGAPTWRCHDRPTALAVTSVAEIDGQILVAVPGDGVFRLEDDGRWTLIDDSPAGRAVEELVPSPRGGVWRLGGSVIERAVVSGDGWRVVERPSTWQGLPTATATDAAEDADGTLWLATNVGLLAVPPAARDAPMAPPPVRVAAVEVDGHPRPLDRLRLPAGTDRVTIRFEAPSWRDAARLRFRYRIRADAAWSPPTSSPVVTLDAPRPGRYQVELAATLDGERWSAPPAGVRFAVAAPWFQRWYAWVLVAGLAAAVTALGFGIRAALARAAQRQRLRIARDLHDEIGSGLGSIGLLAGMLREDDVGAGERGELVARIADTAGELGGSLGDLVWTLKDGDPTIGGVAQRLVARAHDLCADGATVVRAELPEPLPADTLPLVDRRHLLLLGLEALHNAARHAGARTITISLRPLGRHRHELAIADDGRGLTAGSGAAGTGVGLASMEERARSLGARLQVSSSGAGTRIAVVVRTRRAPVPRLGRWSQR